MGDDNTESMTDVIIVLFCFVLFLGEVQMLNFLIFQTSSVTIIQQAMTKVI
jgi:lipid-A-disaccharide synthase-like uncharacterized protein